jgi:hypothetical protein
VNTSSAFHVLERLIFGFIAGYFATLIFHQLSLEALWAIGLAPFPPFSFADTQPFHIRAVFSLSIWGGVWGILFTYVDRWFTRFGNYWVNAFLFGAILPSLVALLIVLPLKGKPVGSNWSAPFLLTVFIINGAWGLGTGIILKALSSLFRLKRTVHA